MVNARVGIIVRSMDRDTLPRALDSIAAQGRDDVEALVVAACGSSHRALPERIGPLRVRLVSTGHALDRAEAGNAGLVAVQSAFAGFLDDDDEMLPGHLDALVAALEADPRYGLAFARTEVRDLDGGVLGELGRRADAVTLLGEPPFHTNAALFRSGLIALGLRFDPSFEIGEDVDFWLQCAMRTPLLFVDRISTVWNAAAGTSGAGAGANADADKMVRASARIHDKWLMPVYEVQTGWRGRFEILRLVITHDRHAVAEQLLARIRAELPNDPNLLRFSAIHAARHGDLAAAIASYERAIAAAPNVPALRDELAALRAPMR